MSLKNFILIFIFVFLNSTSSFADAIYGSSLKGSSVGKPAPRILCIGSSTVQGNSDVVGLAGGFRDHLQDYLGIRKYEFVGNFGANSDAIYQLKHSGIGGETSTATNSRIDAVLDSQMPAPNPDGSIVFYLNYGNDSGSSITPATTISNIKSIIDKIHTHDANINIIISSVQVLFDARETNDENVRALLPDAVAEKFALYGNVYYFDWHTHIINYPSYQAALYSADNTHMNETGYTKLGEWLGSYINRGFSE